MPDIYIEQLAKKTFETALEHNELNRQLSDLRILSVLSRDITLRKKLENPDISFADKVGEVEKRITGPTPEMLELITELIKKNRVREADEIFIEYQRLLDIHLGIEGAEIATITTAIPLDDSFILDIGRRMTEAAGKPVIINAKVDASVIGGIVIKIGDKVIDGSISSRLAALKREISKA